MNNVTIVGLGAIGMVYATALTDAGISVRIAVDPTRKIRYERDGHFFNGQKYDFEYFTPSDSDYTADLVIIATKNSGLTAALELIRPIVGAETQILPLLNGISSEATCADIYGWQRVVYGYFIGHTSTRQGNAVMQDGRYKTYFGEPLNRDHSPRVAAIKSLFDRAKIRYIIPEDMISSMWQKFVINIGMNQATAVLHCTYGHLQTSENARNYMISLMNEAAAVAIAEGISGAEGMVEYAVPLLDGLSPEDGSSMYQDVMSNRATEVDLFADTVCSFGTKHGIETPYNFHAGVILKSLRVV